MVRNLSLDILQRTPTPRELKVYLGAPVELVASRMLGSLEAMRVWVEEELLYFLLLDNFRPQTEAIRSLPGRLKAGQISARDAIAEIMMSTGFSLRNPGNDTFVTVVLEQGLGMRVQDKRNRRTLEAGKKIYDGYPTRFLKTKGKSQADIVKIVTRHEDFARHLLDRFHRRLLRAPLPQDKAHKDLVKRLHAEPMAFFPILKEWLCSPTYCELLATRRPRSDNQFIRSIYQELLGREPRYQEFRNMRNALLSMADPAPLRSVMAKVILDSGRAELPRYQRGKEAEFVSTCFLRYLGREPTQQESSKIGALLKRPEVGPTEVVRALITSTEYQYY